MTNWNEGAITDIPARQRFHREATPIWLVTACTLLGSRAPSLSKPFRYADLGCGTGFTALTVAAPCPRAEVWGFDFNPANIELARDLAEQAGLANIRFMEISFEAMAALPPEQLPQFDFMIAEAVLSVVSAENRSRIQGLIQRHLRSGGLAYLGYNADTGWSEFKPLQSLLRMLSGRQRLRDFPWLRNASPAENGRGNLLHAKSRSATANTGHPTAASQ